MRRKRVDRSVDLKLRLGHGVLTGRRHGSPVQPGLTSSFVRYALAVFFSCHTGWEPCSGSRESGGTTGKGVLYGLWTTRIGGLDTKLVESSRTKRFAHFQYEHYHYSFLSLQIVVNVVRSSPWLKHNAFLCEHEAPRAVRRGA